jgi:UDP-3-O-[3-hydroxymyristoyl] glucosamine N-acyltransferase
LISAKEAQNRPSRPDVVTGDHPLDTTAREIASFVEASFGGKAADLNRDFPINGLSTLRAPRPNSLLFAKQAPADGAVFPDDVLLIVAPEHSAHFAIPRVAVERPRLVFALAAQQFAAQEQAPPGIHPTAIISQSATIDPSASVGAFTVIGDHCKIGSFTRIGHHNVLGSRVEIGRNCIVGSNNVIGEDGFGVEEFGDSQTVRLPSIGGVTIGDDVQIGNFNAIVGGTIEPTVIEDGVQIDNLIHIAHNAYIGAGSLIIACAEVSGSVKLGRRVWLGPNSSIKNGLEIGDDCLVGIGATVIKSSEPNAVLAGNPARKLGDRHK